MVDVDNEHAKAELRTQVLAARGRLTPAERAQAARDVSHHFFSVLPPKATDIVAAYWAIRDELDCQPILVRLMEANSIVVLPAVARRDQPLEMRVWEQGAALFKAGFGTLAPSPLAPCAQPDIVLVPLLGFDSRGTRLGYGGGYYDRTLASMSAKPKLVGLAFAIQELPLIPREAHDFPLDVVITEAGVRFFGAAE